MLKKIFDILSPYDYHDESLACGSTNLAISERLSKFKNIWEIKHTEFLSEVYTVSEVLDKRIEGDGERKYLLKLQGVGRMEKKAIARIKANMRQILDIGVFIH